MRCWEWQLRKYIEKIKSLQDLFQSPPRRLWFCWRRRLKKNFGIYKHIRICQQKILVFERSFRSQNTLLRKRCASVLTFEKIGMWCEKGWSLLVWNKILFSTKFGVYRNLSKHCPRMPPGGTGLLRIQTRVRRQTSQQHGWKPKSVRPPGWKQHEHTV